MQKELFDNNTILRLSFDFSNSMEAQNAESKADFTHKIKIAAKEADKTQYWLLLCEYAKNYPDCKNLLSKLEDIQRVLNKILSTSKNVPQLATCLAFLFFNCLMLH